LHELLKRKKKKKGGGKREIGITLNWSGRTTAFLACINMVVEGTNHHKKRGRRRVWGRVKGREGEGEGERGRERAVGLLVEALASFIFLLRPLAWLCFENCCAFRPLPSVCLSDSSNAPLLLFWLWEIFIWTWPRDPHYGLLHLS